jgi:transcriptional regulator with XRE-family HTH domain
MMAKRVKTKSLTRLVNSMMSSVAYWTEASMLTFTEDLVQLMAVEKVTQAELARRVGVTSAYVSKVLRGNANLTLETMNKLALAMGASVQVHVAPTDKVTRWLEVPSVSNVVLDTELYVDSDSTARLVHIVSGSSETRPNWEL